MRFSISKESLAKALQPAVAATGRSADHPILEHLLITVSDGQLRITGHDLETQATVQAKPFDTEDGALVLHGRKLSELVRAQPSQTTIRIKAESGAAKASMQAGRSRYTLATLNPSDFPSFLPTGPLETLHLEAGALRHLIGHTADSMAKGDVRAYLNGALVEFSAEALIAVATDGHRLAIAKERTAHAGKDVQQLIVPNRAVTELARLLQASDDRLQVRWNARMLEVRVGDTTLATRLIDARFPDYEVILSAPRQHWAETDRAALQSAAERAAIVANEQYRTICLHFDHQNIRVTASNGDAGESEEDVEARATQQGKVGLKADYLIDALRTMQCERVRIQYGDATSALILESDQGGEDRHVLMPVRI